MPVECEGCGEPIEEKENAIMLNHGHFTYRDFGNRLFRTQFHKDGTIIGFFSHPNVDCLRKTIEKTEVQVTLGYR